MTTEPLILASGSPRRRELLGRIGIAIEVIVPDVDESQRGGETPEDYVERVAIAKAEVIAAEHRGRAVLAADTIVEKDGAILGKPASEKSAGEMLRALCGGTHRVTTAFVVITGSVRDVELVTTVVSMRAATDAEISGYVASGEWRGKAGGYAIQGIAAALVTGVSGSVTNVIGLPLAEVVSCLERQGVARADFANGTPA